MKNQNLTNWMDEFIYNEELSDESMYAVYNFMQQVLINFEMKAFQKIRNHSRALQKNNRSYEFQNNGDPF
jgi:hypothetical protein